MKKRKFVVGDRVKLRRGAGPAQTFGTVVYSTGNMLRSSLVFAGPLVGERVTKMMTCFCYQQKRPNQITSTCVKRTYRKEVRNERRNAARGARDR